MMRVALLQRKIREICLATVLHETDFVFFDSRTGSNWDLFFRLQCRRVGELRNRIIDPEMMAGSNQVLTVQNNL